MTSGLSGILDLTRDDLNVFSEIEWNKIKLYFFKKYKLTLSPLSTNIKEKWEYIAAKSLKTGSVIAGRKYLDKLCSSDSTSNSDYNIYKFLEVFLSIQQNAQHILNPIHANKLTEAHYSYSVWMPVFERLFAINNNIIQLKPGESVPEESTNEKMYLYGDDSTNIIGFKIDIRFLFNFQNNEYDLCSLEAARDDPDDEKVYGDHSKLAREGRTNTMALLRANGNAPGTHTWIIQICGLKLYTSTVEYVDNNLFVVVPQFNLDFPTSLDQLGKFIDDFPKLFTIQEDVESEALKLRLQVYQ